MPPPHHVPAPTRTMSPAAQIMSMLLCPLQLHTPHCCPPHGCTHCIAVPLTAACIVLPSPLWLHTLCHYALLCSERDTRWPDVGVWGHTRQRQGFKGSRVECRDRGLLHNMSDTRSSSHSQHDRFRVLG